MARPNRVPLWLKLAYTLFVAVLVPVYWHHYTPLNFLYFCDVALLMTVPTPQQMAARISAARSRGPIDAPQRFVPGPDISSSRRHRSNRHRRPGGRVAPRGR